MEISGKVKVIGADQQISASFKKRTLVVSTEEQYVQHVPIDFVQDKCAILDKYQVGQYVKVSVNVRGNEYNGKYYVSLQGWRIEADSPNAQPQAPATAPLPQAPQAPEQEDTLPF